MHSLIGGDVKYLMDCWFLKSSKYDYSLKRYFDLINSRLLNIKPPQFIPCPPKNIKNLAEWHCKDFLAFILYYALIVFKDLMPERYFNHLKLLVISLENLLVKRILRKNLEYVHVLLTDFVKDMTPLYGVLSMKSGIHELLHIVECTLESGHMNSVNMFQFEEINRKVLSLIFGKDLLGIEFLKNFNLLQTLNEFLNKFEFKNELLQDFVEKNRLIKTSNKKNMVSTIERIKITSKTVLVNLERYAGILSNHINVSLDKVPTISRFYINNVLFTDWSVNTKYCDFFIFDNHLKKYGEIKILIYFEGKVFSIVKEYILTENFSDIGSLKSSGFLAAKSRNFFFSNIANLEKCFLFKINDSLYYINSFKMNHLFT
jgi:hypothetical protein